MEVLDDVQVRGQAKLADNSHAYSACLDQDYGGKGDASEDDEDGIPGINEDNDPDLPPGTQMEKCKDKCKENLPTEDVPIEGEEREVRPISI